MPENDEESGGDNVVIEGLKCCLDADVRNIKYLRAVITDWRESGILSADQVKAHEAEHKSKNARGIRTLEINHSQLKRGRVSTKISICEKPSGEMSIWKK